jgi:hypothetical protein
MKQWFIPALAVMLLLAGCGRDDQKTSGTITLTNELYGETIYYSLGLSFKQAGAISSLTTPGPDLFLEAGSLAEGNPVEPFLSANTLEPSYAFMGEYMTESEAVNAFAALTDASALSPVLSFIDLAAPLRKNQIWVVRTRDDTFAKIRIIEVVLDTGANPDFASCRLEWVWQPDGTATFP